MSDASASAAWGRVEDVRLALAAGKAAAVPMPVASLVAMDWWRPSRDGDREWSALGEVASAGGHRRG